jgi:hypothetical protein
MLRHEVDLGELHEQMLAVVEEAMSKNQKTMH